MRLFREVSWLWNAYPRVPEKPGLLMRIYFFWCEAFTPAGHVAASFLLFGSFFLFAPGFFALKVIELFFTVALILALSSRRRPKNRFLRVDVPLGVEGEPLRISAAFESPPQKSAALESFRMDSSIESLGNGEILPHKRGVFPLSGISLAAPHPSGLSYGLLRYGKTEELLVAPKIRPLKSFPFLTSGERGAAFERLFLSRQGRGTEFVGIREYRDGDSPRDMHAKASARFGRPFTKEFAVESGGGVTLLLDVSASRVREKMCVEAAIRLCGSVAFWLLDRGILGRFFIGGGEVRLGTSDDKRRILESLARIPRAKIRQSSEWGDWEIRSDAENPVLSVSVRKVPFPAEKQIVVVDGRGNFPCGDAVKYVPLVSEDSL